MDPIKDKRIVLGVCGGIAAYRAAELVRLLVKSGAGVRVVMTKAAQAFVGPVTFEALSGQPVWTQMFENPQKGGSFRHIEWGAWAHATVIVPATANIIGKMAHGIADDPLTTLTLVTGAPILVCPSMNTHMYENPVVQNNIDRLHQVGVHIVTPEVGTLACGSEGVGRLADVMTITERLRCLFSDQDLSGDCVLVTAGPTQEPIDPVRFISNPSSGKMGYALARAAKRRGAKVLLISGPTMLADPEGITVVRVRTAEEMSNKVMAYVDQTSIVIKAAAVCDWRPASVSEHKVKKAQMGQQLKLEKTVDILKVLGQKKTGQVLVGFAAETGDLEENAKAKLDEKNLDLVVANLIHRDDSGFGSDTNEVSFIHKDGHIEAISLMDKESLADIVLDRVLEIKKVRYQAGNA